jgi:hypothetical protein
MPASWQVRILSVARVKLAQIARDALLQLGTPPFHPRPREGSCPVVHGFEFAAIDANACRREKTHLTAEFDEARTYLAQRQAIIRRKPVIGVDGRGVATEEGKVLLHLGIVCPTRIACILVPSDRDQSLRVVKTADPQHSSDRASSPAHDMKRRPTDFGQLSNGLRRELRRRDIDEYVGILLLAEPLRLLL